MKNRSCELLAGGWYYFTRVHITVHPTSSYLQTKRSGWNILECMLFSNSMFLFDPRNGSCHTWLECRTTWKASDSVSQTRIKKRMDDVNKDSKTTKR